MAPIIPAIIPTSFEHIELVCKKVLPQTHEVQIDVVDGKFVPFTSWPYGEHDTISALKSLSPTFLIEIDCMMQKPEEVIPMYLESGVRRVVVHLESTEHIAEIYAYKQQYDFKLGLSINNDTQIDVLLQSLQYADYVQLMGIQKIGSQGQPFDTRVLSRIQELKRLHPSLLISIDGSVNNATLPQIVEAGADRCVVGSALFTSENFSKTFQEMCKVFTDKNVG